MITQENIPYTADEIKTMIKTCEKYNKALDSAEKIYNSEFKPDEAVILSKYLLMLFPELKKDNNDERIRKELITHFRNTRCVTKEGAERIVEWIAWLEKQGEQSVEPKWCHHKVDLSDCSEEYRKAYYDGWNNCNMQHSQCEVESNDNDEEIRKTLIDLVKCNERSGYKLLNNVSTDSMITWLENQGMQKPNPYSGTLFEYNGHIWGMCARDGGVEILFDGELKAFLSLEKSFIYPIYPKPDLAHKSATEVIKENVGNNNKVEPKFKVGDWVVKQNGESFWNGDRVAQITNITDRGEHWLNIGCWVNAGDIRLWSINDANDGDVLVDSYSKDSIIILYKGIDKERSILAHCGWNGYNFSIKTNGLGYGGLDNTDYLPATKEQRELLFSKMKQEGYEWNAENKKLSKQSLKITPKFCVGQLITDNNGTWYKITNIKCLDDWYYVVYDVCEDTTHHELCSIIDEKFRENRFAGEIKKMMGD